jgi:hypothetical protein
LLGLKFLSTMDLHVRLEATLARFMKREPPSCSGQVSD